MREWKTKTGVTLTCIQGGGQTTPLPKHQHLYLVEGTEKPGVGWTGFENFGFTKWNDWFSKGVHIKLGPFEYYSEIKYMNPQPPREDQHGTG